MKTKYIIPLILGLFIIALVGTSGLANVNKPTELTNFVASDKQKNEAKSLVKKHFSDNVADNNLDSEQSLTLTEGDNLQTVDIPRENYLKLQSQNSYYLVDLSKNVVTDVRYSDVPVCGKSKNITEEKAHQIAINFLRKHYPEIDLTKYIENHKFYSNYILFLREIDKETGAKLLGSITVIVNQELGKVSLVNYDNVETTVSTKVTIDKPAALNIALKELKIYTMENLISSSDAPVVKMYDGSDRQQAGWIFIFKSDTHKDAIFVDGFTGETVNQREY